MYTKRRKVLRCLFCKEPSSTTKGVEHLIPEAIGSKKLILPKGLVCDKCNNYFSRKVEKPVLSHQSMRNVRAWHQVPNKKGKFPSVKGTIAGTDIEIAMKRGEKGGLEIKAENAKNQDAVNKYLEEMSLGKDFPPFLFPIDIDPPPKEMSRFLSMMGLEALALRFSYSAAADSIIDEPSYDLIRNYARYGTGVKEWPYHRRVIFPMDTEMRHPDTGEWVQAGFGHDLLIIPYPETYFIFLLYGVEFAINLGGPSIDGYKLWLDDNDQISPIVERSGAKLVRKYENGVIKHYLEGNFKMGRGAEFDRERYLGNK
jgi:HNH endonuclease